MVTIELLRTPESIAYARDNSILVHPLNKPLAVDDVSSPEAQKMLLFLIKADEFLKVFQIVREADGGVDAGELFKRMSTMLIPVEVAPGRTLFSTEKGREYALDNNGSQLHLSCLAPHESVMEIKSVHALTLGELMMAKQEVFPNSYRIITLPRITSIAETK